MINQSIVNLNDIKDYSAQKPDLISKENINGVDVYTINNQSFKVLVSVKDEKRCFICIDINNIGYNLFEMKRIKTFLLGLNILAVSAISAGYSIL